MILGSLTKGPTVQPSEWSVHPSFLPRFIAPTTLTSLATSHLSSCDAWVMVTLTGTVQRLVPSQVPSLRSLQSREGLVDLGCGLMAECLPPM